MSGGAIDVEIDFEKLHQLGMVVPTVPRSAIGDSFRSIKRPLLHNLNVEHVDQGSEPNLIMVCSALQGEGKTFTSISLAMSIAMEQDKRVLFVDADVAKASAGQILGVPKTSARLDRCAG